MSLKFRHLGNTPTGVGKRKLLLPRLTIHQKHPHGRGEETFYPAAPSSCTETPPRAWGRQVCFYRLFSLFRNTPTGVGKTARDKTQINRKRKHPHGRGEDLMAILLTHDILETPPRAWGRLRRIQVIRYHAGNTPTGVGKTLLCRSKTGRMEKHPHGRGEDSRSRLFPAPPSETPPRAWGRPF